MIENKKSFVDEIVSCSKPHITLDKILKNWKDWEERLEFVGLISKTKPTTKTKKGLIVYKIINNYVLTLGGNETKSGTSIPLYVRDIHYEIKDVDKKFNKMKEAKEYYEKSIERTKD